MNEKAIAVRDGIVTANFAILFGYILATANRPWNGKTIAFCCLGIAGLGYAVYRAIAAYRLAGDQTEHSEDDF